MLVSGLVVIRFCRLSSDHGADAGPCDSHFRGRGFDSVWLTFYLLHPCFRFFVFDPFLLY